MADGDDLLLRLLARLKELGYRFVTPTPETHRRVVARRSEAQGLRDVLGWSLPFARGAIDDELYALLEAAGMLASDGALYRSRVRASSLAGTLFLHSAYPTDQVDSVFLGPDSYRFVRFLAAEFAQRPAPRAIIDIGTGAGVGAIACGLMCRSAQLTLGDINPLALRFAQINARHAGLEVETVESAGLDAIEEPFDLAIMNPPYMIDATRRAYRDGGEMLGARLSLDWALAAAARVERGGRVLLYTGSAIVAGEDRLRAALQEQLTRGCTLRYEEIDPDVFGEQLDEPGYEEVERIAAIGAVIERNT